MQTRPAVVWEGVRRYPALKSYARNDYMDFLKGLFIGSYTRTDANFLGYIILFFTTFSLLHGNTLFFVDFYRNHKPVTLCNFSSILLI